MTERTTPPNPAHRSSEDSPRVDTVTVAIALATPRALQHGLSRVGFSWMLHEDTSLSGNDVGMYAWVTAGRPVPERDAMDGRLADLGTLYIGIGKAADSGVAGRTRFECTLIHDEASHGHGRAMHRLGGRYVGGSVTWTPPHSHQLDDLCTGLNAVPLDKVRDWLEGAGVEPVAVAEQLAIRLAVHIGDTAPPVNSHYASGWDNGTPADWLAWLIARQMARRSKHGGPATGV